MPTSGSTLPALVGKARTFLNESDQDFWQDSDIQQWIQQAKNLVCKHGNFRFMQNYVEIPFNAQDTSAPMPGDFKEAIKFYVNDALFDPLDFEMQWTNTESGSVYTEFGDNFLFPAQSAAGIIKLYYYRFIPDITAQVSYFDPQYEDLLIDYAAKRGRIKEEMLAPDQVTALENFIKDQLDLIKINQAQAKPRGAFRPLVGM